MSSPSNSPQREGMSPSPRPRFYAHRTGNAAAAAAAASPSPMASPASPASEKDNDNDDNDDNVDNVDDDEDAGEDVPRPDSPDLPLTMTASTVLLNLPRDATAALASAGQFSKAKVVVRFKPVGSAPSLGGAGGGDVRRKITATHKFEAVVAFVRRALKVQESESVFLYVNSAFAPALDEVVGNLHQCFKDSHDQLNVSYSLTPAFG